MQHSFNKQNFTFLSKLQTVPWKNKMYTFPKKWKEEERRAEKEMYIKFQEGLYIVKILQIA